MQRIEWWLAAVVVAAHAGAVAALWQQPSKLEQAEPVVMQAVLLSVSPPAAAATTQPIATVKPPPATPKHRPHRPKPAHKAAQQRVVLQPSATPLKATPPAVAQRAAAPAEPASSAQATPQHTPEKTMQQQSDRAPSADAQGLNNAAPAYPPTSRKKREQGVVWFEVHVGSAGELLELKLKTSSGFRRLDEAAERAVKQWRFQPALRQGKAVDAWYDLPVRFSLIDQTATPQR